MNALRCFSRAARTVAWLFGPAALASTAAWGAPVITGGAEINNSSISGDFMQGYDFVSTTNQSLTALGFWDSGANGLATSYQVGLWQTSTQTLLASATLDNADPLDGSLTVVGGQWRYETLGSPISLTSGTSYTLAFQVGSAGITGADMLLINYPTLTFAPTVTIADAVRYRSTNVLAFPTTSDGPTGASGFRGTVNAQLVPEPGSALLLAVASAGLLARRRRVAAAVGDLGASER